MRDYLAIKNIQESGMYEKEWVDCRFELYVNKTDKADDFNFKLAYYDNVEDKIHIEWEQGENLTRESLIFLYTVITHELSHYEQRQEGRIQMGYVNPWEDYAAYLIQDNEFEANIAGWKFAARELGVPLSQMFLSYFQLWCEKLEEEEQNEVYNKYITESLIRDDQAWAKVARNI